jgi:aerobic carbon-monoxide dehydrogenase medium subunit
LKPAPFDYHAPESLEEALALKGQYGGDSAVLAGGQSLMPMLHLRLVAPSVLIDVNRVAGLDRIEARADGLILGARVRQATAERARAVREHAPLIARALPFVAHPAIRSRGTVGGSLVQSATAAELPAVAVALTASLIVESAARGRRVVPALEFFRGIEDTALEADELLVEIAIPFCPAGATAAFTEVTKARGGFALVGVACVLKACDGEVAFARLALLGVDAVPVRAVSAETRLVGGPATLEAFAEAAELAVADVEGAGDIHASEDYRKHAARVLIRRALVTASAEQTRR